MECIKSLFMHITSTKSLDIITSFSTLVMAVTAIYALKSWKTQERARRKLKCLDDLIENTNAYVKGITSPLTHWQCDEDGIKARINSISKNEHAAAYEYITACGKERSKILFESLERIKPFYNYFTVALLHVKFNFENSKKCMDAITQLRWQYDKLQAAAAILGDDAVTTELLGHLLTIKTNDIGNHLREQGDIIINFADKEYAAFLK